MFTFKTDKPYSISELAGRLTLLAFILLLPVIASLFIKSIHIRPGYYFLALAVLLSIIVEKTRIRRVEEIVFNTESRLVSIKFQALFRKSTYRVLSFDEIAFRSFSSAKNLILTIAKENKQVAEINPKKDRFPLEKINDIVILVWRLNLSIISG